MSKKFVPETQHLSGNDVLKLVAQRIKTARTIRNISVDNLAKDLGISINQMRNYEKAKCKINIVRLWNIAKLLNIDIHFFINDVSNVTQPINNDDLETIELFNNVKDLNIKETLRNFLKVI